MSRGGFSTAFEFVSKFDAIGLKEAEREAAATAERISRLKANFPVGIDDKTAADAVRRADAIRKRIERMSVAPRPGGSFNNQNPFSVEGLGRLSGSIAAIAALDRGFHALTKGLEAYNEAADKGENRWLAFADAVVKSLPVFGQAAELGKQLVETINRANVVTELPTALKGKDFFRFDPSQEDKRRAGLDAQDDAEKILDEERKRERLRALEGTEREREEIRIRAEERKARLAELRQKGGGSVAEADVAEELGKRNDEAQFQSLNRKDAIAAAKKAEKAEERAYNDLEKFFNEVEEEAARRQKAVAHSLDSFFGEVEDGFDQHRKIAERREELIADTAERDLRTAGFDHEADLLRIAEQEKQRLADAGNNPDLKASISADAESQRRALSTPKAAFAGLDEAFSRLQADIFAQPGQDFQKADPVALEAARKTADATEAIKNNSFKFLEEMVNLNRNLDDGIVE